MWLALKLFASGAFDAVVRGLSAAGKWIVSDWRHVLIVILAGGLIWDAVATIPRLRADLAATADQLEASQLAHLGTINNFIDASAEAQRQAKANVARVRAEQEVINREVTRDLRSDLAAVTARFDRLRARAAAADPRHPDPAGLPGPGAASGRSAGTPGHPDLRASRELEGGDLPACPPAFVCLTIDQAERASQDAHRHNRLIDWTLAQSAIRFNPEEPAE